MVFERSQPQIPSWGIAWIIDFPVAEDAEKNFVAGKRLNVKDAQLVPIVAQLAGAQCGENLCSHNTSKKSCVDAEWPSKDL